MEDDASLHVSSVMLQSIIYIIGSFHNEGPLKLLGRYYKNDILGSQDRFLKVVFPLWRLSLKHLRYFLPNNGIKFISKTQKKTKNKKAVKTAWLLQHLVTLY